MQMQINKSKHLLTLAIITIIGLFAACATKAKAPGIAVTPLIGNWQWVQSSGGFAGKVENATESTVVKLLIFDKDGNVSQVENEKETLKDTYTIVRVKSIFTGNETDAVKYANSTKIQSFLIRNDSLFLSEECHDCYNHVYVRKK
jgi:hypothetical protein